MVLQLQWTYRQLVPINSVTYNRNGELRRQGSQVRAEADVVGRQTHEVRPIGVRERSDRINPVGRANLFNWLRGIGAIAEVRCDHHVTTLWPIFT